MKNQLLFGSKAQAKLFTGLEKVYNSVSITMGGSGSNAVFTRYGRPLITNDGVSIARRINLEDIFESLGADLIKQVAEKTNEEAGDGTTTAIVLAYHLIKNGLKLLSQKSISPMKLRKELDQALDLALEHLSAQAKKIESDEELLEIAKISSEDDIIAKLVTEAVKKAGDNGRVVVEESGNLEIEMELIPGMELEGGFISPYMVTHPERMEAVLNNPNVLITDRVFSLNKDLFPLIDELNRRGEKELLVVCRNMDSEMLQSVIANRIKGLFHCVAVKTSKSQEWLEDLAALTGAEAITDGKNIKQVNIGHLGKARKVVATKDRLLVIRGDTETYKQEPFNKRVEELKTLVKEAKGIDKNTLEDRLARLTSSVVVIKSGASTEAEMTYLRMKIEDAVCSVKAAIKEGYVTGGGLTLREVGRNTQATLKTPGSCLLEEACSAPLNKLLENAGVDFDEDKISKTDGFDTASGQYVTDLAQLGVIDPVIVEKSALKNAVSLASLLLTIGVAIADVPETPSAVVK